MYSQRNLLAVLARGGEGWSKFAHQCKELTAPQIRKTLALIERAAKKPTQALNCAALFLRASLDESSLESSWRAALSALDDIQKYPFDATKRAKKLRDISRNPRVLLAWQTAAVGAEFIPSAVMALLILDASEASLDALMPHFDRTLRDRERLSAFEELARYEGPRTASLFARLRSHSASERAASPVLRFGERFGLAKNGRFKLSVTLLATTPVNRFTDDFVSLEFDSDDEPGFSLSTGQRTRTATSSSSWNRVVRSSLDGLPKTIAKLAAKSKVEWDFAGASPKRAAPLVKWLSGQTSLSSSKRRPSDTARTSPR